MPWITLDAKDGHRLRAYREEPIGAASRGTILVLHEITGVTPRIRQLTAQFAAQGYVAVAPALFDRVASDVAPGDGPRAITRGRALVARLNWFQVMLDLAQAIRAARKKGRVGVVGYSFGGAVSWLAAARLHGLACAVSYYPTGILDLAYETPRIPVLLHVGRHDTSLPLERVHELGMRHSGVTLLEHDAGHGFDWDHGADYRPGAAAQAAERTLHFLRSHLG
jgi:carboxymethylenebutenolidase